MAGWDDDYENREEYSERVQTSLAHWIRHLHHEKGLSGWDIFCHFGRAVPLAQIVGILNPRPDSDDDGEPD